MIDENDDRFAERLAVLDEQIVAGTVVASDTLLEEPDLSSRLEGALDCLQRLEQVWPRKQPSDLPAMPRVFGRYHVVRELGRGGFGIVFLAEDLQLARDVAIKVQRPESVLSPEARKRFLREARSSAPLKHANLVTVYDSGEEGLWCWIASEVVHGPSLSQYLLRLEAKSKLPAIFAAVQLVRELADGVAHAHTEGVLHRDIKPANILLEPRCKSPESLADYRAKLADFGLARSLESDTVETRTGARLGTPAYMAPEQAEGHKEQIGPATDVHGLGVLLHELLIGKPPFTGESESDVLKKILLDEPRSLRKARPEISRDLEAVVFKCLEKNPARRYSNARALADDLGRVLANEPTAARPITLPRRAVRWSRRHPATCIAIGAALLSGVALLVISDLARENYELLGYRNVYVITDPPGATVAYAPIDPATGEPIESAVIRQTELTPAITQLTPGDYLVVAALPDGRFHEVLRHVPKKDSWLPRQYWHFFWREKPDNTVQLARIEIPDRTATHGMVLIEDTAAKAENRPPAYRPFYLDPVEVQFGFIHSLRLDNLAADGQRTPIYAAEICFDEALNYAENRGARLPSEAEFEIALARCRPPSELPPSTAASVNGYGPVGVPENDQTDTVPPVLGLRSNVAEWTMGRNPQEFTFGGRRSSIAFDMRTIRGGTRGMVGTRDTVTTDIREQEEPVSRIRYSVNPGVGFRCARSARPRLIDVPAGK